MMDNPEFEIPAHTDTEVTAAVYRVKKLVEDSVPKFATETARVQFFAILAETFSEYMPGAAQRTNHER